MMSALLVLTLAILSAEIETGRWPGFLGGGAAGIENRSIPLKWSPTENMAWKRELPGYGQSSPVAWDGKIYLTSVEGEEKQTLHVIAFELSSGNMLWDKTAKSTFSQKSSVYISRAAPTPLVDENGVYAYFESGDVVHFNHQGELQWSRSLSDDYGKPENEFGLSASPVQFTDRVVILIDDSAASYLVALAKTDGHVLWKTNRKSRVSWSSPAVVQIEGMDQIVCSSAGSVDGYDPQDGKELWTFDQVGGNTATTPLDMGEGRFLIAASGGRRGENAEMAKKSNGLMQVTKQDGKWIPQFLWTNPEPTPSWSSPIVFRDHAYWINRVGVVYCLDMATGESIYKKRIKQSAWATPVGIGDQLYIFGRGGMTTVLAAGAEFNILAENELWTEENPPLNRVPTAEEESEERRRSAEMFSRPTLYGFAIADGSIVMRTGSQLYCIRE